MEDKETENNTDREIDGGTKKTFEGGTWFFPTAQDPSDKTSVYADSKKFVMALINQSAPTLLTIGGDYANMQELKVEDVLPFVFPFGLGGPSCSRKTKTSQEACFQRYFRLTMPQFMRGDVILVLGHMYGRILTYRSGYTTLFRSPTRRYRGNKKPVCKEISGWPCHSLCEGM